MKTTIKITEKDISDGDPGSCDTCPIALALRREVDPKTEVMSDTILIKNEHDGTTTSIAISDDIADWILDFDTKADLIATPPFSMIIDWDQGDCRIGLINFTHWLGISI